MCFWNWFGFGWGFVPIIMMLIILVFLFVFGLPCLRSMMGSNSKRSMRKSPENDDDDALAIAKRRYASGEISKEAFEDIKKTIS